MMNKSLNESAEPGRKQERTAVSLEVIIEGLSGKRQARISDLSLGGCFVDSIVNITHGEKITLRIRTSDAEWLEIAGEIVYGFGGGGFGIKFLSLSDQEKAIIEYLILMSDGNPWGTN